MNAHPSRSIAAPLIIAAAVLAGAHLMLVDPAKRHLAQARAQSAQHEAQARQLRAVQAALPALASATDQARHDAAAINLANAPAEDPGVLFATLADLASEHNVRVDQLDPFTPRQPALATLSPATAPAPTDAPPPPADTQLGYSMTVVASYTDLASFLGAIQNRLGFTRILSVRLAPSPEGPQTITARIQTVHHAFALPSIPAAMPPSPSPGRALPPSQTEQHP